MLRGGFFAGASESRESITRPGEPTPGRTRGRNAPADPYMIAREVHPMIPIRASIALLILLQTGFATGPGAADSPPVPPGIPLPLGPDEARKSFHLADGLRIERVASEPTIRQPVTITFDDRGRLWA